MNGLSAPDPTSAAWTANRTACHACPMEPSEAVAILRRRLEERLPDERRAAAAIRAVVPAVADCLVREFGVTRVVLFGSLAKGIANAASDIDLAVEGLARDALFRAMARAADVAGRPVDIVPLEDVRPRLLAIIERDGQVIRDER